MGARAIILIFFKINVKDMESVLETQRRLHEERDRLIDSMTKEYLHERKSVSFFLPVFMHSGNG